MIEHLEKWALIPSDPAVFDDMIQQYGVQDTKVQELFSIDFEEFQDPSSVYGLMFISRYVEEDLPDHFDEIDPISENIVFTAQVVTNVCGTLALLAVLLNANIDKGEILSNFLQFTEGFSPVNRGLCLGGCKEIRDIHDAYARNANHIAEYAMDESFDTIDDDNFEYIDSEDFHYITYIYKLGHVWELDGLKSQPVKLQECTHEEWLTTVKPFIEKRMHSTAQNELTFSLMAVTKDSYRTMLAQKNVYDHCIELANEAIKKKLASSTIKRRKKKLNDLIQDKNMPHYATMIDIWDTLCQDMDLAQSKLDAFEKLVIPFKQQVELLTAEKEAAKASVVRQKWDYFPFLQMVFTKSFHNDILLDPSKPIQHKPAKVTPKEKQVKQMKPAKLKQTKRTIKDKSIADPSKPKKSKPTKKAAEEKSSIDPSSPVTPEAAKKAPKEKSSIDPSSPITSETAKKAPKEKPEGEKKSRKKKRDDESVEVKSKRVYKKRKATVPDQDSAIHPTADPNPNSNMDPNTNPNANQYQHPNPNLYPNPNHDSTPNLVSNPNFDSNPNLYFNQNFNPNFIPNFIPKSSSSLPALAPRPAAAHTQMSTYTSKPTPTTPPSLTAPTPPPTTYMDTSN